jgi:hypothetical protein
MELELDSTYLISLPQTAIRLWGIEPRSLKDIKIVEVPVRTVQDRSLSAANQSVNELILAELGEKHYEVIARNDLEGPRVSRSILDCNVLNLAHHYPKIGKPREVKVLDYSSLGHRSLVASDTLNLREAARAATRNYRFRKKFSPSFILHWDDYASERKNSLVNFGWSNGFINSSRIIEKSRNFMSNNISRIPEIVHTPLESQIVILAPHIYCTEEELIFELKNLVFTNQEAMSAVESCDFVIVKQHRTSEVKYRDEFTFLGKRCRVLQSSLSRAVPIEIYMHGFSRSTMFSAPSSAIYSHASNTFVLKSRISKADQAEYGLMSHRHKRIGINW